MKVKNCVLIAMASAALLAVDVSYFFTNGALITQINASSSVGSATSSSVDSGSGPTNSGSSNYNSSNGGSSNNNSSSVNSGTQKQRETLIGQSLYITEITGSISTNASLSLGMRISTELAAKLGGQIKTELKDEYTIICYPNGNCPCTSTGWHICASSGCPKAEIRKC